MPLSTVLSLGAAAFLFILHLFRNSFFRGLVMRLVPNGIKPHFHFHHKRKPGPAPAPRKRRPVIVDDEHAQDFIKFQLLLLDNGAQIREELSEKYMQEVKVGPDGFGSYRYSIDGVLSLDQFANAASAREAARQVQTIVAVHGRKFTTPVSALPRTVSRGRQYETDETRPPEVS
jgi:hypothetical protein